MDEHEPPCLNDRELKNLSRYMLPGNPMRSAAQALITRDYDALDQPELYLDILDSQVGPRFNQRLIAAEALRFAQLTPEQSERLEAILRAIVSRRHLHPIAELFARAVNIIWKYVAVYASIYASLLIIVPATSGSQYDNLSIFPLVMFSLLALVCIFAVPIHSINKDVRRTKRLRCVCALALGRWGGPGSIETLIGVGEEHEFWNPARNALQRVLKRLTVDDYGKVSSRAVKLMSEAFDKPVFACELVSWTPLLLDSLEKVGTGAGVAGVENFAKSAGRREWQEHATQVLSVLQARQRFERDSARLLRPTVMMENQDALLKPASSPGNQEDESLLRAVNNEQ